MFAIIGIVLIFVMVFGGYILAGGKLGIILKALPFEMMMIGGAAAGTFLISNGSATIGKSLKSLGKVFGGPSFKKQDYIDVLCLMFSLLRLAKTKGVIAIEQHIEKPTESKIFQAYPKILNDHFAIDLICDSMRMITMGMDDPHQFEEIINKELEKHHGELGRAQSAIQTVADACPALGIVAAVLGVIKTMASINEPPEILGRMIGGALVGTFLGIFLAYGFLGPFASRMKQIFDDDHKFYEIIRDTMVAHLHGQAPQIAIEIGRKSVPSEIQPSFAQLEEATQAIPAAA
jgi:chemotaxis protein MotA